MTLEGILQTLQARGYKRATAPRPRFRVKLVIPSVHDTQMFYLHARKEADQAIRTLEQNVLPEAPDASVYLYVETTLGHVRIK